VAATPDTPLDLVLSSEKLPSPSGVALQILQLTRDPEVSLDDLTRVLSLDPALASQILKYANSASLRSRRECRSVADAVLRLGMATLRRLALGFSVLSNARGGPCPAFDYNRFWSYSLATAVAAQALAGHADGVDRDDAFTCGLLGQVGQLCLASVHPYEYARIIAASISGGGRPLAELEYDELSVSSVDVTAALFEAWGLPADFRTAVVEAAGRATPGQVDLAAVLRTALNVAEVCVVDAENRAGLAAGVIASGRELGLDEATLGEICEQTVVQWNHMGDALSIITEEVPALEELISRAQEQVNRHQALEGVDPAGSDEEVPLRILVVDDAPLDRKLVKTLVEQLGHQVEVAEQGEEALRIALQWAPHLILSDWMMPVMNGLELCRTLRSSKQIGDVYIIMMTANDQSDDLVTALDNGADDYLPKPINRSVLQARLRAAERLVRLQERVEIDREQIRRIAADLSVANRKLKHLALYDGLTGLPNRRYAMDRLNKEWERAVRHGDPLLCMLVDIDHFKRVNDEHGHDAGDAVLREVALAMKDCLRASDDVCRFGGEEFLTICPDAGIEMAETLGDRLRRAVESLVVDVPGFHGSVTVSVGVAGYTEGVDNPTRLLKLADEALYAAKEAGRNKVCIVNPVAVG
jgi:diguanylate cyclase (GGDEF)-like protein